MRIECLAIKHLQLSKSIEVCQKAAIKIKMRAAKSSRKNAGKFDSRKNLALGEFSRRKKNQGTFNLILSGPLMSAKWANMRPSNVALGPTLREEKSGAKTLKSSIFSFFPFRPLLRFFFFRAVGAGCVEGKEKEKSYVYR